MTKQRRAYCRKLVLAHLVASDRHDLRSLEDVTGMPRRTLQDTLADLGDIGIACQFVQDGPKNNHGFYRISDWGDHDPGWIALNLPRLRAEFEAGDLRPA
jgi:hypothetical protein